MRRETGAPSMTDGLVHENMGRNEPLQRLDKIIDWDRVDALLLDVHYSPEGRPAYSPLLMAKVLLLQQWHDLSDPEMEDELYDRISFRRFLGLGFEDVSPDHSTIGHFRYELTRHGLVQTIFDEVNRQLDGRIPVLKKGTIIDVTLVKAQRD